MGGRKGYKYFAEKAQLCPESLQAGIQEGLEVNNPLLEELSPPDWQYNTGNIELSGKDESGQSLKTEEIAQITLVAKPPFPQKKGGSDEQAFLHTVGERASRTESWWESCKGHFYNNRTERLAPE